MIWKDDFQDGLARDGRGSLMAQSRPEMHLPKASLLPLRRWPCQRPAVTTKGNKGVGEITTISRVPQKWRDRLEVVIQIHPYGLLVLSSLSAQKYPSPPLPIYGILCFWWVKRIPWVHVFIYMDHKRPWGCMQGRDTNTLGPAVSKIKRKEGHQRLYNGQQKGQMASAHSS